MRPDDFPSMGMTVREIRSRKRRKDWVRRVADRKGTTERSRRGKKKKKETNRDRGRKGERQMDELSLDL